MQPAHPRRAVPPGRHQLRGRVAVAERTTDPAQVCLGVGQHVGAAQLVELDPVLDGTQEPVRQTEALAVLATDVAVVDERPECEQGRPDPQPLVDATVHQLEQLDGELDVAQPALAELELAALLPGGDVGDHASPHGLGVGDEVLALGDPPHHRAHHVDEVLTEREVPRTRPSLEHGLELPRLGPPLVVRLVAGEPADELPGPALGPQRRVDLPDGARRRVGRADPGQLCRHPGGGGDSLVGGDQRFAVRVKGRLGHEEHVHVADVIELLGAALAQPDDGEPGLPCRLAALRPGDRQRRLQGGVGEVGELVGDLVDHLDRFRRAEVAGGDPQQLTAVGDP